MTREEIKAEAQWELDYDADKGRYNSSCSVMEYIDIIYDDFESRTCSNCKYCEYLKTTESYMCINNKCNAKWITLDFGCNIFERKD